MEIQELKSIIIENFTKDIQQKIGPCRRNNQQTWRQNDRNSTSQGTERIKNKEI